MSPPKPFHIEIPQRKLDILKQKLSYADFPDEVDDARWDRGCPVGEIRRLVKCWETWDWRIAEQKLNEHPQFHTNIDVDNFGTLDIHFIHQKSPIKGAIPLLFVHGWPGSFIEVLKILPLLKQRDGDSPAFHVVAPSLPNFGFSQGIKKRGFALSQYAETCHKLMLQLGYPEYVTQAGDWGFWITRAIGRLYPEACRASHMNMIYTKAPTLMSSPLLLLQNMLSPYSESEKRGFERTNWFSNESRGYNVLQSTKPQTLSYALQDSPVALLGWIYEKLHDWSDDYPWTDDEVLTWISIYYFSHAGPGAASNIYYEVQHTPETKNDFGGKSGTYHSMLEYTPQVKLGLTYNPKELEIFPKIWGDGLGDVVYKVENDRGGHFYAHEFPDLLARDIKTMFCKHGGAYGVVTGKNGYDDSNIAGGRSAA